MLIGFTIKNYQYCEILLKMPEIEQNENSEIKSKIKK